MVSRFPDSIHVYRALAALLERHGLSRAAKRFSCSKNVGTTPPSYAVHPREDEVKLAMSQLLSRILQRPVRADQSEWRLEAGEAYHIARLGLLAH